MTKTGLHRSKRGQVVRLPDKVAFPESAFSLCYDLPIRSFARKVASTPKIPLIPANAGTQVIRLSAAKSPECSG
jgi:hypothetical protein